MRKENIIFVVPLIFFTLLVYAGFYSFPAGDDYCYAFQTNNEADLFSRIINEYETGNGRYISNLFVFNNPIAYGRFWLYHLVPLILLVFALFCIYRMCRKFITCSPFTAFLIALASLAVIVLQQPEISESIYWYTGAVTYFPAGCLAWLIFSFLPDPRNVKKAIFIGLLSLIIIGFNESIMQVALVFAFLFFLNLIINRKLNSNHIIPVAIVVAASLVVILSPGNSAREELFSGNQQLLKAVTWSFLQSVRFTCWYLLHPSVILLTVAVVFFPLEKYISESVKKIKPFFYLILIFTVLYLAAFAPYYFTGVLGQHRTYNLAGMLFYPLYFAFLFSCCENGYFNMLRSKINSDKLKKPLIRLSVLLIPFCYYGYFLFKETADGTLKSFYENHLQRETDLKQSIIDKNDSYILPFLTVRSEILESTDTDGTDDHWIFFCAAEFHKSRPEK